MAARGESQGEAGDRVSEDVEALGRRLEALQLARANTRAEKWARVQAEYPEHAALMQAVARVFGKPVKVRLIDLKTAEVVIG